MRVRTRILSAAAIAVLAGATFFAAPVSAGGPCPQPSAPGADGMWNRPGKNAGPSYTGRNVYNLDGYDQQYTPTMGPGETKKAFVKYRNADNATHDIRIDALLKKDFQHYDVTIVRWPDGKDITDRVFGDSGFRFRNVPAKKAVEVKVFITQRLGTPNTADLQIDFQGNYGGLPVCGDTVLIKPFSEF